MIKIITYEQSRMAFFKAQLAKAERRLAWAVKNSRDCETCAERGEAVSFYEDIVKMLEGNNNE